MWYNLLSMFNCVRCGFPLYESDRQSRELILCCIFAEKICPTCLADFVDQEEPQILSVCQRCGRKIKLSDLHRKYSLYTNNLDRIMASSRVRYNQFEVGSQMKRTNSYYNGFEGFGMQPFTQQFRGEGTFNKGFRQGPTQNPMFSSGGGGNRGQEGELHSAMQNSQGNDPFRPKPNHLRQNPNEHFGQIYFQQGFVKPLVTSMNDLNMGQNEDEGVQQMQVEPRESRFSNAFYKTTHFQDTPANNFKQVYQPSFGHSNYFAQEAANRKTEIEKHQRSLSSSSHKVNNAPSQTQSQRPLSSNSRVCRLESRVQKSPPSFGKE